IDLKESTRKDNARFFGSLEEVPTQAITMGIANIMFSKKILLLASGLNKAAAVKAMIENEPTENCPASVLQKHPDVVIIVDELAASLLKKD
ncbi:MAG: glucosamine-6-phosphate deaminase, partial [Clostridia bacterium]